MKPPLFDVEVGMEKAIVYRTIAAKLRRDATNIALERARQIKLAAAERWDELAAEIEMVVAPSTASVRRDWIF
jgi:hypothetical protein